MRITKDDAERLDVGRGTLEVQGPHPFPTPQEQLVLFAPHPDHQKWLRDGEQRTGIPAIVLNQYEAIFQLGAEGKMILTKQFSKSRNKAIYVAGLILGTPDGGDYKFSPMFEVFDGDVDGTDFEDMPSPEDQMN